MTDLLVASGPQARIVNGDVLEKACVFDNDQFRLIITSPPYNIGKRYEKKIDLEAYLAWQDTVIDAILPKLAFDGSIVWQVGNYVQDGEITPLDVCFYPLFKKRGLAFS